MLGPCSRVSLSATFRVLINFEIHDDLRVRTLATRTTAFVRQLPGAVNPPSLITFRVANWSARRLLCLILMCNICVRIELAYLQHAERCAQRTQIVHAAASRQHQLGEEGEVRPWM
jgi:hypothetical protein